MKAHKTSLLAALALTAACAQTGDSPDTETDNVDFRDGSYFYVLGYDAETGTQIRGGAHQVVTFDEQGKAEAIDSANRVSRFHPAMQPGSEYYQYDASLTEGESDVFVFASTWWPQSKNGTAQRWQPGANQDYSNHSDTARLSPVEKYDALFYAGQTQEVAAVSHCQYRDYVEDAENCTKIDHPALTVIGPATKWELENQGTYQFVEPENWWGHCNGWASYATTEPLGFPERDVTVRWEGDEIVECTDSAEGCVQFKMADVEGLMTELYFSDKATFSGRRCNTMPDDMERDEFGRPTDPACRDLNAGAFHIAIVGAFGRGAESLVEGRDATHPPFVIDYNYDHEIWNFPVIDFEITSQREVDATEAQSLVGAAGSAYQFNPAAKEFREVAMTFHMISDSVPTGELLKRADARSIAPVPVELHYVLELDSNGQILGGEWLDPPSAFVNSKELHPDFVWMATEVNGWGENSDDLGGDDDNPFIAYSKVREILLCANEPETCAPAGGGVGGNGTVVVLDVTSNAAQNDEVRFTTETLEPGTYSVTMTHDAANPGGDADLYVRAGAAPTRSTWDCRPYAYGSDEECSVTLTEAAVIHVMVHGYDAGSNAFRLVIEGKDGGGGTEPPPAQWEGLDESGTVARNEELHYSTGTVAAGTYEFVLSGTNDADLYVRTGSAPTTTAYNCRPYLNGSAETCSVSLTSPGEIFVMVRGYANSSNFGLVGSRQ